ncbi:MAG TPA: transporter substrate-binding domain-containing protein [Solirubrobacteraceae bacterium]|nr:transporter substrate-binding domain-containing protein [Solirubrobacteraceae bacterium]
MPRTLLAAALLITLLTTAACQFPRDVGGTLDNVKGGTLRVGLTEAEPWVSLQHDDPSGVEVGLIREFAAKLGAARVDYTTGTEEELVEALHARELDVVIGGITDKTRWKKEAALTKPYLTTHLVIGMPPGQDLQDGTRVITENGRSAAALVERKTDAVPVRADDLETARGKPAAVDEWLLDDLGLREAKSLEASEHVMLTAPGENGFLVELEHFLLDRKQRALELLDTEGRP